MSETPANQAPSDNDSPNEPKGRSLMAVVNKLLLVVVIVAAVVLYMRSVEQGREVTEPVSAPEPADAQAPLVETPAAPEQTTAETASAEVSAKTPATETDSQTQEQAAVESSEAPGDAAAASAEETTVDDKADAAQTVPELSQEEVLRQIQEVFAPETSDQSAN